MSEAAARWRSLLPPHAPVRHWDGDCLVFNPRNASTHLLSSESYEVLRTLQQSNASLLEAELARELAGDDLTPEGFALELARCLQHFEDLGLAESLPA